MRVLHINNVDLLGNRFNGHDMQIALNKRGIAASQVVMERMGDDPHTIPLAGGPHEPYLRRRLMECERELSLHGMIYPYLYRLRELPPAAQLLWVAAGFTGDHCEKAVRADNT